MRPPAVSDVRRGVPRRRRARRGQARLPERADRDQPDGRGLLRLGGLAGRARRGRSGCVDRPAGQLHGPDADGRAVRPVRDVRRPRRRDRQQDRVPHRLHDPVR